MGAYFVLVGGTFAVSWVYYRLRKHSHFSRERKNYELIFFFAFYILMLSLRASTVGADTSRYIYLYNEIKTMSLKTVLLNADAEQGYRIVEKLISYVLRDPQMYLALMALITIVPIAYLYYKEAELPLMTMSLFIALPVFHMAFTGLRQMVAITFAVPIFYAAKEKKLVRFLILILIAYFFHQSAFILLLLYPIYHLKPKAISLVLVLPIIGFIFLFNSVIYKWLMHFVPERFLERYDKVWDTGGNSVLIMLVLLVILCFFMIRSENLSTEDSGLRNILVLSAIFQCFAPINGFAMRINYYFILFVPIAIGRIFNRADDDKRPFAAIGAIAITVIMLYIFFSKGFKGQDGFKIFPYGTCFSLFS